MKNKILRFYEKARDSIFILILYLLVFFAIIGIGGYLMRFSPVMKFIGLVIIILDIYFLFYFPTFKKKIKE